MSDVNGFVGVSWEIPQRCFKFLPVAGALVPAKRRCGEAPLVLGQEETLIGNNAE